MAKKLVTKPVKTKLESVMTESSPSIIDSTVIESPVAANSLPKMPAINFSKDQLVPFLVGAIIIASFVVGYLYGKVSVYEKGGVTAKTTTTTTDAAAQPAAPTISQDQVSALVKDDKNLVFGNKNAKLVFVEFSDPSCPFCHIAAGHNGKLNTQVGDRFKLKADGGAYVAPTIEMKKLVDQNKAAFVWLYSNGHGNGEIATQALYCANEQGKFWPVHDLFMSADGYALINDTVKNDVKQAGVLSDFVKGVADANKLKACIESAKYATTISENESLARSMGVNGTPSFFVNTKNYAGAYSYTDMEAEVKKSL